MVAAERVPEGQVLLGVLFLGHLKQFNVLTRRLNTGLRNGEAHQLATICGRVKGE